MQTLIATVGSRRMVSKPPTLDDIRAAVVASQGRLDLQTTGRPEEYRIRAVQGHTEGTELASLGQALGSHEAWMLHATALANFPSIWRHGLHPYGAPVQPGHAPRQDLYFGLGTDPRARFSNPRTHPCSKLTDGRNVMVWIIWGVEDPSHPHHLMRVTDTGAIITRTPVPRRHLYLVVLFSHDTVAMVVVAASQQAHEARSELTEAFSHWGVLTWPGPTTRQPTGPMTQIPSTNHPCRLRFPTVFQGPVGRHRPQELTSTGRKAMGFSRKETRREKRAGPTRST